MKIRNGYVSNSSSSSFLIVYKKLRDFGKFKAFKGYDRFMEDLKKATDDSGLNFLANFSVGKLYSLVWDYRTSASLRETMDITMYEYTLHGAAADFLPDVHLEDKIREEGQLLWSSMEKEYPEQWRLLWMSNMNPRVLSKEAKKKWDELCERFARKGYELIKELSPAAMEEGVRLYKALVKEGWKVRSLEYNDQADDGHMEHCFMPFLACCPEGEGNFHIVRQNNH